MTRNADSTLDQLAEAGWMDDAALDVLDRLRVKAPQAYKELTNALLRAEGEIQRLELMAADILLRE